jgi:hypothetical protein
VKNPQFTTLYLGQGTLTISEDVSGIPAGTGLGAFSVGFFYPMNLIQVTVREGPFLRSTGRITSCFTTQRENFIGFYCLSTGASAGPTGSGTLASIYVSPRSGLIRSPTVGNGVLVRLDDQVGALAGVLGDSIEVGLLGDAEVRIQALEGDLNLDCAVNVLDEQLISFRYYAHEGSLLYDPWYDLQPVFGDGDIDIKDLQFVFGRDGWTCEHPGPRPTPTPIATATATAATTATSTPTAVGTPTPTTTRTATVIATATSTPVSKRTATPIATAIATYTPIAIGTATPTVIATATSTPVSKRSPTPIATATATATAASTPIATRTPTPTVIATATSTPTAMAAATATSTPTAIGAPTVTVTGTPAPAGTAQMPTPTGTGTPSAAPVATATPPTSVGPISTTPVPQGPVPTETPVGGVLPDLTRRARVLPSTGSGPAEGWTTQTTIAAGILAGVGLALLLLTLYRRPSGRGP